MTGNWQQEALAKARAARRGFSGVIPVPVEKIATKHGIKIETAYLDDELSGMSFVKNDVSVIVVNGNHHPNRRRFTVAHELGHHLLHRPYLENNVHVDKVIYRNEVASQGTDRKEIQANAFAAELLMPASDLARYHAVDFNDEDFLADLAKRLKVSVSALTYRLVNLGKL